MIIIDTSAWIEFLRDTGSPVCSTVDDLLGADLAICDAISMEVRAGAYNEQHRAQLRGMLARAYPLLRCRVASSYRGWRHESRRDPPRHSRRDR